MTTTWTITSESGTERAGSARTRVDAAAAIGTALRDLATTGTQERFIISIDNIRAAVLRIDTEFTDPADLESTYRNIDQIESAIAT